MLTEATVAIDEVADALGMSPEQLRRRARALHERSGFPLPLPASRGVKAGVWRWSRRALTLWIDAAGAAASAPAGPSEGTDAAAAADADERLRNVIVLAQHRALQDRYGGRR